VRKHGGQSARPFRTQHTGLPDALPPPGAPRARQRKPRD
jgi:hypothetical protein